VALVLPNGRRTATVRTRTFCDMYRLEKEAVEEILLRFPHYKEHWWR